MPGQRQINDVEFAKRIIQIVTDVPNLVENWTSLPAKVKRHVREFRHGKNGIPVIMDMQEWLEKMEHKRELDRDDAMSTLSRLLSTQTEGWADRFKQNFEFAGSLMPRFSSDKWINTKGRYDSGSDVNLIKSSILDHAGYVDTDIEPYEGSPLFAVDGSGVRTIGRIRLAWRDDKRQDHQTVFLVSETLMYDMVIGGGDIERIAALVVKRLPKEMRETLQRENRLLEREEQEEIDAMEAEERRERESRRQPDRGSSQDGDSAVNHASSGSSTASGSRQSWLTTPSSSGTQQSRPATPLGAPSGYFDARQETHPPMPHRPAPTPSRSTHGRSPDMLVVPRSEPQRRHSASQEAKVPPTGLLAVVGGSPRRSNEGNISPRPMVMPKSEHLNRRFS